MIAWIKTQWYQRRSRRRKQLLLQLHDRFLSEEGKKIARSEVALSNARPHIPSQAVENERPPFLLTLSFLPIEIERSLATWRADSFAEFLTRGNCRHHHRRHCRYCCCCCRRRRCRSATTTALSPTVVVDVVDVIQYTMPAGFFGTLFSLTTEMTKNHFFGISNFGFTTTIKTWRNSCFLNE